MTAIPINQFARSSNKRNVMAGSGWTPSNMNIQQHDYSPSRFGGRQQQQQQKKNVLDTHTFDPYARLEQILHQPQLNWIHRPDTPLKATSTKQQQQQPDVPQRYRIALDCRGFKPDSLKCEFKDVQGGQKVLRIVGLEEAGKKGSDSFKRHELNRSFMLPGNVNIAKMVSYLTPDGKLIVEFPLRSGVKSNIASSRSVSPVRQQQQQHQQRTFGVNKSSMTQQQPKQSSLSPTRFNVPQSPTRVGRAGGVDAKDLKIRLPLPAHISPDKIKVSINNGDLIMRCEDSKVDQNEATTIHAFLRYKLPNNIDVKSLKCVKEDSHLLVTAPLHTKQQFGKQQQMQQHFGGQQQQHLGGQQRQLSGQQQLAESFPATGVSKKNKKNKNKSKATFPANVISI